jgi:glycosyltransferase involved in cell wall biosynthesis
LFPLSQSLERLWRTKLPMSKICGTFEGFAVVGYKDDTGIGRQCHNMRSVLGIGYHLVAPSTRLPGHALDPGQDRPLRSTASRDRIRILTRDLEGVIVIERNKWHQGLFETLKELRKILIVVPNWEWFDANDRSYRLVDLFVVHSRHAYLFLNSMGFSNVIMLPPPIDLALLPLRHIKSLPVCFVHNAGIIDLNDRKGTFLTLKAWARKKPSRARLVLNYQKSELPFPDACHGNVVIRAGSTPAPADLYLSGQCAIQPSRLEGLGYMVLEPILCGIPTITTDVPPMNEWLAGTVLCRADLSSEHALPRRRGLGSATLHDADIPSLTAAIEDIETRDLSGLSKQALELRRELAPERVRTRWRMALQQF